jgi:hypothetical protein
VQDFNQWLTLIANFAVVFGIIFLALEVRHNTKVAQTQSHTELMSLAHDTFNWNLDPRFSEVVIKASEDYATLTPVERNQHETYVFQLMNLWEHAMGTHSRGLMSDSYWKAFDDTFRPNMESQAWLIFWENAKPSFSAEFQQHVDSYIES